MNLMSIIYLEITLTEDLIQTHPLLIGDIKLLKMFLLAMHHFIRILTLPYQQKIYYGKCFFCTTVKLFWTIQNIKLVLNAL